MSKPSEDEISRKELRDSIIGLGERSIRKSYYPELQQRLHELERVNAELLNEIAERKKGEQALLDQERYFKTLFENAGDAILIENEHDCIIDVNNRACDLLGYKREELLQMHVPDIQAPQCRGQKGQVIKGELQRSYGVPFETIDMKKDGTFVPVEVTTVNLDMGGNNLVLSIVRDIRERKQTQAEKEKLQVQLLQSQKLESVGRLAGGVAHDYNNMLGVILGHADLAMLKTDETHPLYPHLSGISKAAHRSAELTQQLLAFARRQTIDPRILDLNGAVTATLQMLRMLIGENISLDWCPGPESYPVKIDPNQFDQLLMNLCVNARDAISGIGRISIETENLILDAAYCATNAFFSPGDYAVLSVSDNGCGMDKETQEKIFEPFFTTKDMGKGTGLGLATVYGIVKQNDGFINVYSEPARGTTFRIYLPRYADISVEEEQSEIAAQPRENYETVLVVEDEEVLLEINTTMLRNLGYKVLTAGTPTKAIHLAEEHAGTIDLLMTDVVLPEMNGRELERHIRKTNPGIAVLFMSGYSANVISHHGVLDKGVHFIQKPFTLKDVASKVRRTLDGKFKNQEFLRK